MDVVAYSTHIHQNRMTQNVNSFKVFTLTKQAGALFVSRVWKLADHKQGTIGFKISFQWPKALSSGQR